jgi:hypothetical protein
MMLFFFFFLDEVKKRAGGILLEVRYYSNVQGKGKEAKGSLTALGHPSEDMTNQPEGASR